jgi:hypothetical protein
MDGDTPESGDHGEEGSDDRTPSSCRFPASYSDEVLASIRQLVPSSAARILDPFAGPEGVRRLHATLGDFSFSGTPRSYLGVEIEPEWAQQGEATVQGDATKLQDLVEVKAFDPQMIITSPPYGNRMADQYLGDPKGSQRHTYAIALGRRLSDESAAKYQWGPKYQQILSEAIRSISIVLPEGGWLLWNIANHYRKHELRLVVPWTVEKILAREFELKRWDTVKARKLRHGANHDMREDYEQLFLFRKTS